MVRVMFVCHGNICRSPMAEFVFKDMIKKRGMEDKFYIASSATSTEELGNAVHYGTRNKLREHGISVEGKYAVQLNKQDYDKYDFLIGMDQRNITNMKRITGADPSNKISALLFKNAYLVSIRCTQLNHPYLLYLNSKGDIFIFLT